MLLHAKAPYESVLYAKNELNDLAQILYDFYRSLIFD